jgi:hypothetical protein
MTFISVSRVFSSVSNFLYSFGDILIIFNSIMDIKINYLL